MVPQQRDTPCLEALIDWDYVLPASEFLLCSGTFLELNINTIRKADYIETKNCSSEWVRED